MIQLDMWTTGTNSTAERRIKQDFRYAMGPFAANVIGSVTGHAIWEHMVFRSRRRCDDVSIPAGEEHFIGGVELRKVCFSVIRTAYY